MELYTKEAAALVFNGMDYGYGDEDETALDRKLEEMRRSLISSYLIVVFGASEEFLQLRGVVDDEVGAWGGVTIYIGPDNDILKEPEYCSENCIYKSDWDAAKTKAIKITAKSDWPNSPLFWDITANVSGAHFTLKLDGEDYCRGIVINVNEARKELGALND